MTKTEKRFWSKVDKGSECWVWTGALTNTKYGRMHLKGKSHLAHRISYEMEYGAIPNRVHVCHTCDTPACVRPSHLFIGSQKENMADCKAKGRVNKGSSRPLAKLTELQIKDIRKDTRVQKEISKDYNIAQSQISRIKCRQAWKHVR